MKEIFSVVVIISLIIHIVLIAVALQRVWRGENTLDRVIAADAIGTMVLAIFIILGLSQNNGRYIDLSLGFAALSFIAVIALARYVGNRQMS
jgi:multisubunit Na+/H+ antiporter MnhF subunit